jgi:hypothetical protein
MLSSNFIQRYLIVVVAFYLTSIFTSTSLCKSAFSTMYITKSKYRPFPSLTVSRPLDSVFKISGKQLHTEVHKINYIDAV